MTKMSGGVHEKGLKERSWGGIRKEEREGESNAILNTTKNMLLKMNVTPGHRGMWTSAEKQGEA